MLPQTQISLRIEYSFDYRQLTGKRWHSHSREVQHSTPGALGRNSIVGTTVRNPLDIPENLVADEKHTWILGNKAYIATTVGNGCILGVSIAKDAGEEALMERYGVFKNEATRLNPEYAPKTANTDGWKAPRKAWTTLFPSIARLIADLCENH